MNYNKFHINFLIYFENKVTISNYDVDYRINLLCRFLRKSTPCRLLPLNVEFLIKIVK